MKGGFDLVGDAYNAAIRHTPAHPDPNPLDCFGHGSHTAGTAAGYGVTSGGAAYTGPYNSTIYTRAPSESARVWPRRRTSTRIASSAAGLDERHGRRDQEGVRRRRGRDQHVARLGLRYSRRCVRCRSTNVARAGVIVVASSGNNGANQYITGSPAQAPA